MKKIEAIIRPERFDQVRLALHDAGYHGLTVTSATGFGEQKGPTRMWRGRLFTSDAVNRLELKMVVPDKEVDQVTKIIIENARTGHPGDGRIYVQDVGITVHIRTGGIHTGVEEEKEL
ncbi:MAG TPA: P-II family nitrogen regulator [Candidatus Hypogeohydataceae bacterium YC41]